MRHERNFELDDRMPFHALIPVTTGSPIDVYEQSAALQMAVIERDYVKVLTDEWDAPGVYILLDRPKETGEWGVYVGKAPAGIRSRLMNHVANKDTWYRAVLVKRDTTHGYNSAHTAWLEGRLYDLFNAATNAYLHNKQRPGDDTLASHDLPMLESAIDPISRFLRLIGHDPSDLSEANAATPVKGTKKMLAVTLSDLIHAGFLNGSERLTSAISTISGAAQVLPDGNVEFDGHTYTSPSSAGLAARGGPVNGWELWAVETPNGKVRLATIRARFLESKNN